MGGFSEGMIVTCRRVRDELLTIDHRRSRTYRNDENANRRSELQV